MAHGKLAKPYNFECQALLNSFDNTTSGWLRFYNWRQWLLRYAVLCRKCLYIYKNETGEKPWKKFSLNGYAGEIINKDMRYRFKIFKEKDAHRFEVTTEKELNYWLKAFEEQGVKSSYYDYLETASTVGYDYGDMSEIYEDPDKLTEYQRPILPLPTPGLSNLKDDSTEKYTPIPPPRRPISQRQSKLCEKNNDNTKTPTDKTDCYSDVASLTEPKPCSTHEDLPNIDLKLGQQEMEDTIDTSASESDYQTCDEDDEYYEKGACRSLKGYSEVYEIEREKNVHFYSQMTTTMFSGNSDCSSITGKKINDVLTQLQLTTDDAYRRCLQDGVERHRKINIFVVGKKHSGKSSLTRRLLKEPTSGVSSTNGMDVHVLKCKAKLDDGKWISSKGRTGDQEIKLRLLNSLIKSATKAEFEEEDCQNKNEHVSKTEQNKYHVPENIDSDVTELFDFSGLPDEALNDVDTAPIEIWDFAGDQESYHAHVPFFRNEAIYILTTNIMEKHTENSKYDLDFWLEVIRCHCKKQSSDEHNNPPVVIVGTHLDQYQGSTSHAKRDLKHKVNNMLKNSTTKRHIIEFYVISNTNGSDENFDSLRRDIIGISQKMPFWNRHKPLHWIQLEHSLFQEVQYSTVVSKSKIQEIAMQMTEPLKDEREIEDFLHYHHDIGTLLYFDDLPDTIVLSAKWLSDALKCIITADEFQTCIQTLSEFEHFRVTGQLTEKLIDEIFCRQPEDISFYQEEILKIMEKFNIIVRPKILEPRENVNQEADYVVPSMIQSLTISTINDKFYPNPSKTSCLCFEFMFLPPALVCQYLVTCARHFTIATGPNNAESKRPFFYRDASMFNIDETGCTKLLVAHYKNVIQNQIWRWGSADEGRFNFLQLKLVRILETLIEGRNISYTTKFKCSNTDYEKLDGMIGSNFIESQMEYFCEEHGRSHSSEAIFVEWFPSAENRIGFSREQHFATILGIIILDILTDILYDRLSLVVPTVKPRNECDITYLYSELRKTRSHKPSSGRWGGSWSDLQPNEIKIGDDIERIRLTRNDMQHSPTFAITKEEYDKKIKLLRQIMLRMESHNKKGRSYSNKMDEIIKRRFNMEDLEKCKRRLLNELPRLKLKSSYRVKTGEGCTLDCKIVVPLPDGAKVKWMKVKDGKEIEIVADESTKTKYTGAKVKYPSLNILSASKDDEGYYSCHLLYPIDCAESNGCAIVWPETFLHVY